jgi:hypothetical protein
MATGSEVEVAKWRQQSEGKDRNGAMTVQEIIHSDNEIYVMILNK